MQTRRDFCVHTKYYQGGRFLPPPLPPHTYAVWTVRDSHRTAQLPRTMGRACEMHRATCGGSQGLPLHLAPLTASTMSVCTGVLRELRPPIFVRLRPSIRHAGSQQMQRPREEVEHRNYAKLGIGSAVGRLQFDLLGLATGAGLFDVELEGFLNPDSHF